MKRTATVYWLLPAKPERDLFCEVVRILRKEFRAPSFEPHLTLFVTTKDRSASAKRQSGSDLRRGEESPKKVLQKIKTRPIRLHTRGVGFSSAFTKTLFIRFKSNPALRKLVTDLGGVTGSQAKTSNDPHVSLLYKKMPRAATKELAAVMKLPFRTVIFDSIAAVRLSLPVRTGADVEKWKIIAKKSLQ
jgi:2'-5' RNA ligase